MRDIKSYADVNFLTADEIYEFIAQQTPEDISEIQNFIASKENITYFEIRNYVVHKYFGEYLKKASKKKAPSLADKVMALTT